MNESPLWYVAYGSNMDPAALRRYLPAETPEPESRALALHREVYFAGRSKTWGAAVAFLTLHPTYRMVPARAFLLDAELMAAIVRGENGLDFSAQQLEQAMNPLHVGEHARLPLAFDFEEGYRGKYDALLRLDDIGGVRAFTLTTGRQLTPGEPAAEYHARIQQARQLST